MISQKGVTLEQIRTVLGGSFPKEHPEAYFQERIDHNRVWIAQINGDVAGFLVISVWWGNTPYIELVKIRPEHQRQGIGSDLMQTAFAEIKNNGYDFVISSTEVINDSGLGFHQSLDFEDIGILDMPHGKESFFKINL